jgi:hypothetical protein
VNQPALHVAAIDFPEFYAEAAGGLEASRALYGSLSHTGSDALRTGKVILHQAARMVWLGDQLVAAVARGRPALQIMFYMIAAEAVAKLAAGYEGEGRSRAHVRLFFDKHCTAAQRERIHRALDWAVPRPPRSPDAIADYLYDIRCEVVHRGHYFEVTLPAEECIREVRDVVLEGAVRATQDLAKAADHEGGRSA